MLLVLDLDLDLVGQVLVLVLVTVTITDIWRVIGGLTCSPLEVVTVTACRQTCSCPLLNAWFTAAAAWTPVRPRTPHYTHIQ